MYHARSRKTSDPALSAELRLIAHEVDDHLVELEELQKRNTPNIDALRGALLSVEGRGAQKYWAGVKALLPAELAWEGRRHRRAADPINASLNYGYAILARHVEHALVLAGLDPFAGFVHVDRPGKTSLTFDLIEEFRQAVVDRTVLGMANRNVRLAIGQNGLLEDEAKKTLAAAIIARIEESGERYEGKKHTLREIIQTQARHLAVFLRGDRPAYEGFVGKW
jgi:CRISPR-associated protein Cas1